MRYRNELHLGSLYKLNQREYGFQVFDRNLVTSTNDKSLDFQGFYHLILQKGRTIQFNTSQNNQFSLNEKTKTPQVAFIIDVLHYYSTATELDSS